MYPKWFRKTRKNEPAKKLINAATIHPKYELLPEDDKKRPLAIVGIDPGTTLGYAVIGLDGKPILIGSARGAGLPELLRTTTGQGIPVIAATDKMKCPELVYQYSAKTGARLITPPHDLLTSEKREIFDILSVDNSIAKNNHELDALSAALFAFIRIRKRLSGVDEYLTHLSESKHIYEVKRLLIEKDNLNIEEALKLAIRHEIEKTNMKNNNRILLSGVKKTNSHNHDSNHPENRDVSRAEHEQLRARFKQLNAEHKTLRSAHQRLLDELESIEKSMAENTVQGNSDPHKKKGLFDSRRFRRLLEVRGKNLKASQRRERILIEKLKDLTRLLADSGEKTLAKKMDSLSYDEFLHKNKTLRINKGDVLIIKDPNRYNQTTLDAIKGKVSVIICLNKPNKMLASNPDFLFIDREKIRIDKADETDDFALVNNSEIDRLRKDRSILHSMLTQYKDSRKKEF